MLKWLFERSKLRTKTDKNTTDTCNQTCLCAAKRNSFYDDLPCPSRSEDDQEENQYGFSKSVDKNRQRNINGNSSRRAIGANDDGSDDNYSNNESETEEDLIVHERLKKASSFSPANIPMLVVLSFRPDKNNKNMKQIDIQRGFPVNAQYMLNEWLFIKTADNEQGFVPYICCRPVFRRQSMKCDNFLNKNSNDYSSYQMYRPHDFGNKNLNTTNSSNIQRSSTRPSCTIQDSPLTTTTATPPSNKKLLLSTPTTAISSQPIITNRSKITDVASSCGDSGFSDSEISNHLSIDSSTYRNRYYQRQLIQQQQNRSMIKQSSTTGLVVHDIKPRCSMTNENSKTKLSISKNSAFRPIQMCPSARQNENDNSKNDQYINQMRQLSLNNTTFIRKYNPNNQQTSNRLSLLRQQFENIDTTNPPQLQQPKLSPRRSSVAANSTITSTTATSSPYIRRTPFARRSLPYHSERISGLSVKNASSPDPFAVADSKEKTNYLKRPHQPCLRHVVLAETILPPSSHNEKLSSTTFNRHFSDLSLNQIENDSLSPIINGINGDHSSTTSFSTASTSSSSSTTSSSCSHLILPDVIQTLDEKTKQINNNNHCFIHNICVTV
ncbi:unnamed protein product [Didymodactylos carnosus]|uniref:SH3 domain-containing protein n=1 Tax=Didymodactylos carnosus TaxID=1234261 RepID=A0A813PNT1_9BILA|nr:unnamed protein product [Didymodactylos carnosus]CAF3533891.1 unnamed protein product [Didymodactylos carnosus]